MKKIFHFTIFSLGWVVLLTSCVKDKLSGSGSQDFRILIPSSAPDSAFPKRAITFEIEVYAKEGLEKVEVRKDFQLVDGSVQSYDGATTSEPYTFAFTPNRFELGKSLNFVVVAYNSAGYTLSVPYTLRIKEAPINISMTIPASAPDTLQMLGEPVGFPLHVISEMPLTSITTALNGVVLDSLSKTSFADALKDDYDFHYTPADADAGQLLTFTFAATDAEDKVKTATYTVFVKGVKPPKPVKVYDVSMGGQNSTTSGQFLSSADGVAHFRTGVAAISSSIDLVSFVSGASTGVNLTAPSFANNTIIYTAANSGADAMASWPVRNATKLVRLSAFTQADFNAVQTDNQLVDIFENAGATTDNVNKIQPDNMIIFETAGGKHGLIWVKTIPPNNSGSMQLAIKMEP